MTARPILIIEDEHALGTALSFLVRRMGHIPTLVASGAGALTALNHETFAAIILDIGLPDISGLQLLDHLRQLGNTTPVLVITAHATLDHAIHSQKSGATAYLTKPLDLREFEQTLTPMLSVGMPPQPAPPLPESSRATSLIGAAPCLRDTFIGIARACAGDVPTLITGPSGAGKSLTAAVIHAHSTQAGDSLIELACSQLEDPSQFERLTCGTVVLDEVTHLSVELQARLAAWLAITHLGRARLLATTTHDPHEAVRDGTLRQDLFYALTTLTIPLPPLSHRSGDIPALASFFAGMRCGPSAPPPLTPPVIAALQAYPWPGNVRELRHVIDYAVTMSGGGPVFPSHLPSHIAATASQGDVTPAPGELESVISRWLDAAFELPENERPDYDTLLDRVESIMLRHLLERHENKPTRLAAALHMHRSTLRQKLRRTGLQRDDP